MSPREDGAHSTFGLVTAERDGYYPDVRFFDPKDELLIVERRLPHWSQSGVVIFLTWRTHDSMPKSVLEEWRKERNRWLRANGIDPAEKGWKIRVQGLLPAAKAEYHEHFTSRWHGELDVGHGACLLARPAIAEIVADSLQHFDGERYELLDFVVMPNHVHLLATFADKAAMLEQCESWKHFTGRKINRLVGAQGRFWRQDAFDHLVRHEAQFRWLQRYIAENPHKAGLPPGKYVAWSSGR